MKRTILVVLLLCATAFAQDNPLSKPVWEIGPWFGGGTGLGHASEFKFINAGVRFGRVLTHEIGDGRMRGTFEWAADIMPVYEIRQAQFYSTGPTKWIYGFAANPVVLKWNWTGGKKVVPYFAAEGGLLFSSDDVPAVKTSSFNFLPGGAFGLYFLRNSTGAVDASVHITHISNASLSGRNPGINATMQFRIGYTWFK
ncbi:MAG TPA: acyloxyacyl hydrolase [Terriglobales bacterium]